MLKSDLGDFSEALNALAEVYGKGAITQKAMRLWFDVLAEFEAGIVLPMLRGWAKTNSKFPAPNDVWKALNENASRRREEVAEAEKKMFAEGMNKAMATPAGARSMALIRQILSRPKPSPREHWRRVMETEGLPPIAYKFASDFLSRNKGAA